MIEVKKEQQDLIELIKLDDSFALDVRYATNDNFTKEILYKTAKVFIRTDVGVQLVKVQQELKTMGLGLKVYDAYRPYHVSVLMWEVTKILLKTEDEKELEKFVGNPKNGSRHNRGAAVDVTLINLSTGDELIMPTPFDDFSYKASRAYYNEIINDNSSDCDELLYTRCSNAKLLQDTMEKYGFIGLDSEWWHFDATAWIDYDLLDISFEDII